MRKIKVLLIGIIVFALLMLSLQSQQRRPKWDCCVLIWATGCYLGWSSSLMWYTQIRERWSSPDQTTYDNIVKAGQALAAANNSCSSNPQAWPNWRNKQSYLNNLARNFANNPSSRNRRLLANTLQSTFGWGNALRYAVWASRPYQTDTCAEKYFKMGWTIAYSQQTLKIAYEAFSYGNPGWTDIVKDAKRHLGVALTTYYSYRKVKPATGRCVNMEDLAVAQKIRQITGMRITATNLKYMIQINDWLWENMQRRLYTNCLSGGPTPPSRDVNQAFARDFVGTFNVRDPKRSYSSYHGSVTLKSDGSFIMVEYLNGRRLDGKGKWSFDRNTKVFVLLNDSGSRFSGKVVGTTNDFTMTGRWSNGQPGQMRLYR